ncbi:MAG: hypothetical protein MSS83_05525 [Methanobrevibacter sp.]|uniref:hypothetical protein n=1 Tax=Methanobrevibacter sp. TaxID=66852 RepID=UPI0031F53705|nr:hypothetical protein [Methanobrevibacter sp.]
MIERYIIKDRWIFDTKLNKNIHSIDCYEEKNVLDIMNGQDQRIAELEEQLKNAIVPKFETYQPIFYITQFYTSTKGNPEYDIISDKYYVSENENEIILGWNYANDFNRRKYYYVRKDWVFATKAEAEAKLRELQGEKK